MPRAAAARPRAGRCRAARSCPGPRCRAVPARAGGARPRPPCAAWGRRPRCRAPTGAGTAHSSGTPCPCGAGARVWPTCPARRRRCGPSGRWWAPTPAGAAWTCPSHWARSPPPARRRAHPGRPRAGRACCRG